MSDEILFLAHRIPFPPDRGDKIRSHHLLHALAQLAPVHVGCFGETPADMACEGLLANLARSHCLIKRDKSLPRAGIEALASGRAVSLAAFASARLRDWVQLTLATRPIDTVFVFSGQMGQFVPDDFRGRLIVDLCDVDSIKFEDYARDHAGLRRALYRREARLVAREEARLAVRAEATLLVTEQEAGLLRNRLPERDRAKVVALGNGIDTALFDPSGVDPHTALADTDGPHLVFTGQMDYPPNIAAAQRIARRLLPGLRVTFPKAQAHIVGRAPTGAVQQLANVPGVTVWGEVADVRPFLAGAHCVVAPLTIARGVQNKVLEAMAMARPVALSRQAATGIAATDGQHFAIGEDDAALIRQIERIVADPVLARDMGEAARRHVIDHQSWAAALAPLPSLVGRDPAAQRRDAA